MKFGYKIAAMTMAIVLVTVLGLLGFAYQSQRTILQNQMETQSASVADQLGSDFASSNATLTILKQSLKTDYLKLAKAVREDLRYIDITQPNLQSLAERLGIAEIHIMD
ncbi:hypothetical protein [Cohnella candidum]|uniref:Uncharacterized protein n=1 Tax=Cohnella candidum TaxID=2674991 RepID=A0A3G3K485_9BACL|nr:hypothetical protein [Cohnella candidum]AYQ74971.1 hypothetical protein EAV92_21885 [Cohnella candidum]